MRTPVIALALVLGVATNLFGHPQSPITRYVQVSTTVYVVKATEVSNGVITFSVEETIKGVPATTLTLHQTTVPVPIAKDSEWLLARTACKDGPGYFPINTVGWAIAGDYGWVNAPIQKVDGEIHLVGEYGYIDPALAKDPSKGLGLKDLRKLASTPPFIH